jgi:hypothetical protein
MHNDALLVSFSELLHLFEKEAFRLLTKPRLHRLLDVTCATRADVFSDQDIHPLDVLVRV